MSIFDSFKDIDQIAAEKTDRKDPGATTTLGTNQFYDPKAEEKKPEVKTEQQTQAQVQPTAAGPLPKISKERAEMSGAANAYIWGGSIEVFWMAIGTIVNSFSMSRAEKKHLLETRKKLKSNWSDEDKLINEKFNDLFKTHQERKETAKLSEEESKALRYAYTLYAEVTGEEKDPSAIKWAALIRVMAGKGLDIYG